MVGPALFIAMVTTSLAFFSNMSSELEVVQQFGLAAGLAIIFAFLLLGLALPAIRMILQERKERKVQDGTVDEKESKKDERAGAAPENKEPARVWKALAKVGTKPVLVIILVVLITIPLGYMGLQIEGKMPVEDFINAESDFVVGLTQIYFAHPAAMPGWDDELGQFTQDGQEKGPGIFSSFVAQRIEYILKDNERHAYEQAEHCDTLDDVEEEFGKAIAKTIDQLRRKEARGITLVAPTRVDSHDQLVDEHGKQIAQPLTEVAANA